MSAPRIRAAGVLLGLPPTGLDLEATIDSGQVFGFHGEDGGWRGRIGRGWAAMEQLPEGVRLRVLQGEVSAEEVRRFLDLDRDLTPVYAILGGDPCLRPALERYRGLRLIRQDPWEALAGFILSSNNNVKRIQRIWSSLCARLGEGQGELRAFPDPARLAGCHEGLLRELGLGYRAPYLSRTALYLSRNPLAIEVIREASYEEALERVLAFPGIGPKVADCVLLYGFQRFEAFPVDVWILRAMRKHYFRGRRVSPEHVRRYARRRWGSWAGYVQQYLFHASRRGVI